MESRTGKALINTGAAVALSLMPVLVQADASNYNFLQLDYQNEETGGVDMDGWRASGSFRFTEDFFVAASYSESDLNEEIIGVSRDGEGTTASLGFIFAENATASVFGTAGYRQRESVSEVQDVRARETFNGYDLGLGARINLSPEAELRLGANYVNFGDGNELTIPSVGLVYRFTRHVAGSVDYQTEDEFDIVSLGFRFYF